VKIDFATLKLKYARGYWEGPGIAADLEEGDRLDEEEEQEMNVHQGSDGKE
jgi:hypothetical protein